jgi:predicted oxidoreductase (fatty acid repression mutant protein)
MKTYNTLCDICNSKRWKVPHSGTIRDKLPTGMKKIQGINAFADNFWKGYLENAYQRDNFYIHLRVANDL